MSSFRNIIARRRPSSPEGQSEPASVEPAAKSDELMQELLAEISPSTHSRLIGQPPAPPELPRWKIDPPRKTMGADLLRPANPAEDLEPPHDDPTPAPERPKIWDIDAEKPAAPPAPQPAVASQEPAGIAETAPRRAVQPDPAPPLAPGGRVKTRLLGFHCDDTVTDAFAQTKAPAAPQSVKCPVGWVVIVDGPGRGESFALAPGLSTLGRDAGQTIALDFGDDCISRNTHASIAYDEEENQVLIGHGGKSNLVRLNGKPLVSSAELSNGDQFRIGKTTLRYVALCGPGFSWSETAEGTPGDD